MEEIKVTNNADTYLLIPNAILTGIVDLLKKANAERLTLIDSQIYVPANALTIYTDLSDVLHIVDMSTNDVSKAEPLTFDLPGYANLAVFEVSEESSIQIRFIDEDTIEFTAKPIRLIQRLSYVDEELYRDEIERLMKGSKPLFRYRLTETFYKVYNKLSGTANQVILTPESIQIWRYKTDIVEVQDSVLEILDTNYNAEQTIISVPDLLLKFKPNAIEYRLLSDTEDGEGEEQTYIESAILDIGGQQVYINMLGANTPVTKENLEQILEE